MAKKRPFATFYSNGTVGRAATAQKAAERAVKACLEGVKHSQVYDDSETMICSVSADRRQVTIIIHRPRKMRD